MYNKYDSIYVFIHSENILWELNMCGVLWERNALRLCEEFHFKMNTSDTVHIDHKKFSTFLEDMWKILKPLVE